MEDPAVVLLAENVDAATADSVDNGSLQEQSIQVEDEDRQNRQGDPTPAVQDDDTGTEKSASAQPFGADHDAVVGGPPALADGSSRPSSSDHDFPAGGQTRAPAPASAAAATPAPSTRAQRKNPGSLLSGTPTEGLLRYENAVLRQCAYWRVKQMAVYMAERQATGKRVPRHWLLLLKVGSEHNATLQEVLLRKIVVWLVMDRRKEDKGARGVDVPSSSPPASSTDGRAPCSRPTGIVENINDDALLERKKTTNNGTDANSIYEDDEMSLLSRRRHHLQKLLRSEREHRDRLEKRIKFACKALFFAEKLHPNFLPPGRHEANVGAGAVEDAEVDESGPVAVDGGAAVAMETLESDVATRENGEGAEDDGKEQSAMVRPKAKPKAKRERRSRSSSSSSSSSGSSTSSSSSSGSGSSSSSSGSSSSSSGSSSSGSSSSSSSSEDERRRRRRIRLRKAKAKLKAVTAPGTGEVPGPDLPSGRGSSSTQQQGVSFDEAVEARPRRRRRKKVKAGDGAPPQSGAERRAARKAAERAQVLELLEYLVAESGLSVEGDPWWEQIFEVANKGAPNEAPVVAGAATKAADSLNARDGHVVSVAAAPSPAVVEEHRPALPAKATPPEVDGSAPKDVREVVFYLILRALHRRCVETRKRKKHYYSFVPRTFVPREVLHAAALLLTRIIVATAKSELELETAVLLNVALERSLVGWLHVLKGEGAFSFGSVAVGGKAKSKGGKGHGVARDKGARDEAAVNMHGRPKGAGTKDKHFFGQTVYAPASRAMTGRGYYESTAGSAGGDNFQYSSWHGQQVAQRHQQGKSWGAKKGWSAPSSGKNSDSVQRYQYWDAAPWNFAVDNGSQTSLQSYSWGKAHVVAQPDAYGSTKNSDYGKSKKPQKHQGAKKGQKQLTSGAINESYYSDLGAAGVGVSAICGDNETATGGAPGEEFKATELTIGPAGGAEPQVTIPPNLDALISLIFHRFPAVYKPRWRAFGSGLEESLQLAVQREDFVRAAQLKQQREVFARKMRRMEEFVLGEPPPSSAVYSSSSEQDRAPQSSKRASLPSLFEYEWLPAFLREIRSRGPGDEVEAQAPILESCLRAVQHVVDAGLQSWLKMELKVVDLDEREVALPPSGVDEVQRVRERVLAAITRRVVGGQTQDGEAVQTLVPRSFGGTTTTNQGEGPRDPAELLREQLAAILEDRAEPELQQPAGIQNSISPKRPTTWADRLAVNKPSPTSGAASTKAADNFAMRDHQRGPSADEEVLLSPHDRLVPARKPPCGPNEEQPASSTAPSSHHLHFQQHRRAVRLTLILPAPGSSWEWRAEASHVGRRDALARIAASAGYLSYGVPNPEVERVFFFFEDGVYISFTPEQLVKKVPIPGEKKVIAYLGSLDRKQAAGAEDPRREAEQGVVAEGKAWSSSPFSKKGAAGAGKGASQALKDAGKGGTSTFRNVRAVIEEVISVATASKKGLTATGAAASSTTTASQHQIQTVALFLDESGACLNTAAFFHSRDHRNNPRPGDHHFETTAFHPDRCLVFLGAVRDVTKPEAKLVKAELKKRNIPHVTAQLGSNAEFTSKIIDVLLALNAYRTLAGGLAKLLRDEGAAYATSGGSGEAGRKGSAKPAQGGGKAGSKGIAKSGNLMKESTTGSSSLNFVLALRDARTQPDALHWMQRACISHLWRSHGQSEAKNMIFFVFEVVAPSIAGSSSSSTISAASEKKAVVCSWRLSSALVSCMNRQHKAAPSEENFFLMQLKCAAVNMKMNCSSDSSRYHPAAAGGAAFLRDRFEFAFAQGQIGVRGDWRKKADQLEVRDEDAQDAAEGAAVFRLGKYSGDAILEEQAAALQLPRGAGGGTAGCADDRDRRPPTVVVLDISVSGSCEQTPAGLDERELQLLQPTPEPVPAARPTADGRVSVFALLHTEMHGRRAADLLRSGWQTTAGAGDVSFKYFRMPLMSHHGAIALLNVWHQENRLPLL